MRPGYKRKNVKLYYKNIVNNRLFLNNSDTDIIRDILTTYPQTKITKLFENTVLIFIRSSIKRDNKYGVMGDLVKLLEKDISPLKKIFNNDNINNFYVVYQEISGYNVKRKHFCEMLMDMKANNLKILIERPDRLYRNLTQFNIFKRYSNVNNICVKTLNKEDINDPIFEEGIKNGENYSKSISVDSITKHTSRKLLKLMITQI